MKGGVPGRSARTQNPPRSSSIWHRSHDQTMAGNETMTHARVGSECPPKKSVGEDVNNTIFPLNAPRTSPLFVSAASPEAATSELRRWLACVYEDPNSHSRLQQFLPRTHRQATDTDSHISANPRRSSQSLPRKAQHLPRRMNVVDDDILSSTSSANRARTLV